MRATLVASGASCKLRVSKGSKSVMTRPLELDEEAIHGADACASTPEMVWTLLPSGAVLLKVKLWEEDPAMGKMLLGQDIFILPPM